MRERPPPAAADLVSVALTRALREIGATGGPVLPTSMHRDAHGDRLQRYSGPDLPAAVANARAALEQVDLDTWVLVWDGYLTADGVRTEALYAHLEVVGEPHAHLYAWRYQRTGAGDVDGRDGHVYLGTDGRFASPERSHPLPPPGHPTGAGRRQRWWRRWVTGRRAPR